MFSPLNFCTDIPRLHNDIRLQAVDHGGFPHPAGPGHCGDPARQHLLQFLHALAGFGTDSQCRIHACPINLPILCPGLFFVNVHFVKTDDTGQILLSHHYQKSVQQIEIGPWLNCGKNHKRLVRIGHSGTYQPAVSGQQTTDIAKLLFTVQNIDLHFIPHQGTKIILSENALCPAFVDRAVPVSALPRLRAVYIIKTADSLDYPSLHNPHPTPE